MHHEMALLLATVAQRLRAFEHNTRFKVSRQHFDNYGILLRTENKSVYWPAFCLLFLGSGGASRRSPEWLIQGENIMRLKALFLSTALAVSFVPATGVAQGVSIGYPTFIDYNTWDLYGSASVANSTPGNGFTYSVLNLTTAGTGDQAGAAFAPNTVTLDFDQAFNFNFSFYTSPGSIAAGDGMTFVLTPDAPATMSNLEDPMFTGGSNLGYGNSGLQGFAFAIDTFHFDGEPVSPSIQLLFNGSNSPTAYTETGLTSLNDPNYYQWSANLDFTPSGNNDQTGTLTGSIDQFVGNLSYSVSVVLVDGNMLNMHDTPLYYGFTAANGLADDGHHVSSAMAVPEPETYALMLAGLGLVGFAARRRA